VGFTHDPQLVNAAHVFTSWCNAAGGIDGRRIVADIHDTSLFAVVPAVTAACGSDFVMAGGSAALDGLGVRQRLQCLLPDFPAQADMTTNINSGLQVYPITYGHSFSAFAGYYNWLLRQAYPGSGSSVAVVYGDTAITQTASAQATETLKAEGASTVLQVAFPPTGVANWTPYAESIKNHGVKGLSFYGTPQELAGFELALTNIGYKLDWIDTDPDSYTQGFIQIAGKSLSFQRNYADIFALFPPEKASSNPSTAQVVSLFHQYAPGQPVTLQVLQAFSAWLIFAASAESCGADLTRKCVYQAALTQTAWTGGGLTAPVNLAQPDSPPTCMVVEQASPDGWQPAAFGPNDGAYRCGLTVYKFRGNYPQPVTLPDVGKSLSDLR
jgi:ABC-type branched-subunit amino acid transport system substrate-binding protein